MIDYTSNQVAEDLEQAVVCSTRRNISSKDKYAQKGKRTKQVAIIRINTITTKLVAKRSYLLHKSHQLPKYEQEVKKERHIGSYN